MNCEYLYDRSRHGYLMAANGLYWLLLEVNNETFYPSWNKKVSASKKNLPKIRVIYDALGLTIKDVCKNIQNC